MRTSAAIALVLLASLAGGHGVVKAQDAEAPAESGRYGRIPVQVVGGRLVASCDLSTERRRIPANLFIDLEGPSGLQLHNRAVGRGALEAELGGNRLPITVHFPGLNITVPGREHGDQEAWEDFTKYYSDEIGENAVVGAIAGRLLSKYHLVLDVGNGYLELAEQKSPGAALELAERGVEPVAIAVKNDVAWLPVRLPDGRLASMGLGTARFDTRIDARLCDGLGHAAGDVGAVTVGSIDLASYVALRPDDVLYDGPDGTAGFVGLNLLKHLRVEIDLVNRRATVQESVAPDYPHADLAFFKALVQDESAPLLTYLDAHPESRCAQEASVRLLDLCIEEDAPEEAVRAAVGWVQRTQRENLRATAALDLCEELASAGNVAEAVLVAEAGIPDGRKDRYPESVHKLHARIGALLLDAGEGKRAWKHLLSAAFGEPEDGLVNLHLGRYYEEAGRLKRAFSRYVQASIKPESGARALEGLARVQDQLGGATLDVDEIERLIEGKVQNYTAATKFEQTDENSTNRISLVEFFTSPHILPVQGGLGGALGNEGVITHFGREHVAALAYHLPSPQLSPLSNALGSAQARFYGLGGPAHVVDGQPKAAGLARSDEGEKLYREVRQSVREAMLTFSDFDLSIEGEVADGHVRGTVTVDGPEAPGVQLLVILVERGVLYPGKSTVVVHRLVARGPLTPSLEGEPYEPVDGKMKYEFDRPLAEIDQANEAYLDSLQRSGAGSVERVSMQIDPKQVSIVAYLRATESKKVLQAVQLNPRGAEPDEADE